MASDGKAVLTEGMRNYTFNANAGWASIAYNFICRKIAAIFSLCGN